MKLDIQETYLHKVTRLRNLQEQFDENEDLIKEDKKLNNEVFQSDTSKIIQVTGGLRGTIIFLLICFLFIYSISVTSLYLFLIAEAEKQPQNLSPNNIRSEDKRKFEDQMDYERNQNKSIAQSQSLNIPRVGKSQNLILTNPAQDLKINSSNFLKKEDNEEMFKESQYFSQKQNCQNYSSLILKLKKKIIHLRNIQNQLKCSQYDDLMFDDYDQSTKTLFYLGNYQVFFRYCKQNITNQYKVRNDQLFQWNKQRHVIQWAILNLQEGDTVYVDQSKQLNMLQIIILSHIVGKDGKIFLKIIDLKDTCVKTNLGFHGIGNIFQIEENITISYDFYIGEAIDQLPLQILEKILQKGKYQAFIKFENPSLLKNLPKGSVIEKYTLAEGDCDQLIISNITQGPGFFFIRNYFKNIVKQDKKKIKIPRTVPQKVLTNYFQFKQKLIRKAQQKIYSLQKTTNECACIKQIFDKRIYKDFFITIYGNKVFTNATKEQLMIWEQQRQPIQWIRQKNLENATVIYYLQGKLNQLNIIQISLLIKNSKIIVLCDDPSFKNIKIQKYYSNIQITDKISNIINQVSQKGSQPYVITDNQYFLEKMINSTNIVQKNNLLIFLNEAKSLGLLKKMLRNYELKQIVLRNYSCQGFDYANLFWNSNRIAAFFEVRKSNRYIFVYWDGLPNLMPYQKEHFLYQMSQTAKVQIKILNDKLFLLMESDQIPIHKTYPILSAHHKSDYFRNYLMHFYGGGYADLKHIHFDWNPYFQNMEKNPQLYASGYPQQAPFHPGCQQEHGPPNCTVIRKQYKRLLGNTNFIYRRNTTATYEILTWIHKILDKKQSLIYKYPAVSPRQFTDMILQKDGVKYKSKYPLRWGQLSGQIRSRVCFRDLDRYSLIMPYVNVNDYLLT